MKIVFHRLFELRRAHAKGLLDGLFDRNFPYLHQSEISSGIGQFVLVEQVVHHDPRLRVEHRRVA